MLNISAEELEKICQGAINLASQTEFRYYNYIRSMAKKNNVPYDELLFEIRKMIKSIRYGNDVDLVKYYHATSIESFNDIIDSGFLLSREERKKRGIDISNLLWSSSSNVQFSRDYIENGRITVSGYKGGRGATACDVTFVFGKGLYDEDTFDCSSVYPTVSSVNIKDKCLAIIVNNNINKEIVEKKLVDNNMSEISIYISNEWNINITPYELEENKNNKLKNDSWLLHNLQGESKIEFAKKKLDILDVNDPLYKYYIDIIRDQLKLDKDKTVKIDYIINKDGSITSMDYFNVQFQDVDDTREIDGRSM